MIRPEAKATMWRWREMIAACLIAVLGARWVMGTGLIVYVGVLFLFGAGMLGFIGLQRGRFRHRGEGPGVVQIVEGRVSYFGPLDGGFADINDLTDLRLDGSAKPAHWLLGRDGQLPLGIPVNAAGADALFDAFSALPNIDMGALSKASQRPDAHPVVIWRRAEPEAMKPRLH